MNLDERSEDKCVVCEKDVTGVAGTAHVYRDGRRFSLCCPTCLQMFQRAPDRFTSGERPRTVVEELLRDLDWKESKW